MQLHSIVSAFLILEKSNYFVFLSFQYLKPPKVDFKQRKKMKGKGGSVNAFKAKKIVRDQTKKQFLQTVTGVRQKLIDEHKVSAAEDKRSVERNVLDRFKPKKKK